MKQCVVSLFACLATGIALCSQAAATTVYRSVDENGVVSFSDKPPADAAGEDVETLNIEVTPPQNPEAHRERVAAMRETTDRMAEARREREKHRAQMRELEQPSQQQAGPVYVTPARNVYHTPYYQPYYRHERYRKPYNRYLPYRDDFSPQQVYGTDRIAGSGRVMQPGNQQLMRPLSGRRSSLD